METKCPILPTIKIEKCREEVFCDPCGHHRKLVLLTVRNIGEEIAASCLGRLTSKDTPQEEYKLHWVGTDVEVGRDDAIPVDILPQEPRELDVVFSIGGTLPPGATYTLKGTSKSTRPTTGTFWRPPDHAYMDKKDFINSENNLEREEVFHFEGPKSGAWIAMPFALWDPELAKQARLESGRYDVTCLVHPINGHGDNCNFTIISSDNWMGLTYEKFEFARADGVKFFRKPEPI
jgi:hypothetical protein